MATPNLPATRDYDPNDLVRLAHELARNLRPLPDVLKDYGISEDEFRTQVDELPFFKRALEAAVIEWNSAGSTMDRLKLEAAVTLERGLIHLGAEMMRDDGDLGKQVEVAKLLANISGASSKGTEGAAGADKVSIVINLGGDQKLTFEKPIKEINATPATEAVAPVPEET